MTADILFVRIRPKKLNPKDKWARFLCMHCFGEFESCMRHVAHQKHTRRITCPHCLQWIEVTKKGLYNQEGYITDESDHTARKRCITRKRKRSKIVGERTRRCGLRVASHARCNLAGNVG